MMRNSRGKQWDKTKFEPKLENVQNETNLDKNGGFQLEEKTWEILGNMRNTMEMKTRDAREKHIWRKETTNSIGNAWETI